MKRSFLKLVETLHEAPFYGEPAQLCDAGFSKIKGLSQLIVVKKFLFLFRQLSQNEHREAGWALARRPQHRQRHFVFNHRLLREISPSPWSNSLVPPPLLLRQELKVQRLRG